MTSDIIETTYSVGALVGATNEWKWFIVWI